MNNIDYKAVGLKIREIRNSKNITQEYLADKIDISLSHISNIENGKKKVSLTALILICNELNVTLDYVLGNVMTDTKSMIEHEILNQIKDFDDKKKEQLLRIAKVL